jgi:hypothetical protein
MARILKIDWLPGDATEPLLMEPEWKPVLAPDPFWESLKADPQWQTDRWINRGVTESAPSRCENYAEARGRLAPAISSRRRSKRAWD